MGIFFTLGLVAALWGLIKERRLARTGVLIFARVVEATTRMRTSKSSTTSVCDVRAVVEHDGLRVEVKRTIARGSPLRLGDYPCLVEPGNLDNLVLKLQ